LGIFNEIIVQINSLNEDLDDGDQLNQFFGLMQRYNGNKKMNKKLKLKIEQFFDYKWNNDKLQAIDDPAEMAILDQLPHEV
jgi:hypothetical protein